MAALLEAKAILRMTAEPARRILRVKQAGMKQIQTGISAATVERWRKAGETELQPRRRLALLCGHARSGTTLLEYVLDAHPQIISADESSVFQCKAYPVISRSRSANDSVIAGLDWITPRNLRHIRAEYFRGMESFLGQPVGDRLLIDKNPALTADIPAICCILPETRFLVVLRDPRDVCLSCFMQPAPVLPDTVPWLTLEDTIKHYVLLAEMWLALKPCLGSAALEVRYEDLVGESGRRRPACARFPRRRLGRAGAAFQRARAEQDRPLAHLRGGHPARLQDRHWPLAPLPEILRAAPRTACPNLARPRL